MPKEKKPFYKKWWFWGLIALIAIMFVGCGDDSSSSDSSSSEKTEKASSAKSSSEKDYSTINKEISDTINENKKYAEQGNSSFNGYSYIDKVEYVGNGNIDVYVYSEFNSLSDEDKTNLLNEIQGTVQMPLLDHNEISNDECKEGLFITAKLGDNSVARSKVTNHKEYKFYK